MKKSEAEQFVGKVVKITRSDNTTQGRLFVKQVHASGVVFGGGAWCGLSDISSIELESEEEQGLYDPRDEEADAEISKDLTLQARRDEEVNQLGDGSAIQFEPGGSTFCE